MRFLPLSIVVLGLCGTAAVAQNASPAGVKTFGGWTGTCNNLGACVALGTTEERVFFYVRIARDAGASAAPQVKIVLVAQDKLSAPSPAFRLVAMGAGKSTPLGPFPATTDATDMTQFDAVLAPVDVSLAFIDSVRNADALDFDLSGAKGTLDLKGLSATLRWIDAQQGRAGTPTALVAQGMTPIGQVPDPREAPTVTAAAPDSVTKIAKPTVSQPVLDAAAGLADCEKETVQAHQDFEAWQFGPDQTLFIVPCSGGAYNFTSALYLTDAKGQNPRAVNLPQPRAESDGTAANVIFNEDFDPKTMTLSDFAKGRGIGDCGAARSWVWTGKTFLLFSAALLEACPGAMSEDWPNIFTARRG